MTLQEFYSAIGGDYEGVLSRLLKEERIMKYVLKFLDDTSYGSLCSKIADGDYEEAFRASHTIKGVASNLGFKRLFDSSHALTEELRGGNAPANMDNFERVKADYEETVAAIRELD